jgi:hypothetical protein
VAAGRGLIGASQALLDGFRGVYEGVVAAISGLGRVSRRSQTGDLNWNSIGLAIALAFVLLWFLWEVV